VLLFVPSVGFMSLQHPVKWNLILMLQVGLIVSSFMHEESSFESALGAIAHFKQKTEYFLLVRKPSNWFLTAF
jgi:cytochrome c oxidase subunit IV